MLDRDWQVRLRKTARVLARLAGCLVGVGLGLALWNGLDRWLLGYLLLGGVAFVAGQALIPLYLDALDED